MFCLKVPTDSQWVDEALRDLGALLVDHAHCELKAASNALSLAARHPTRFALVRALSDLAREEVDHFQQVLHLLEARGLPLGEPRTDTYAAALRYAASRLPRDAAIPALVDRLLVAAVIEARSCERFKLLMTALEAADAPEIFALYQDLFPSEARHYRTFYDLAVEEAGGDEARVRGRLDALAEAEARIVAGLATEEQRSTVHG
jgi:tRNA-(ms[2]io[6]A)-hydroxylase